MSIQVITLDGKTPAEGGKRLGYLVGNLFFPLGTSDCLTREQACIMYGVKIPQPAPKKTTPSIIYGELPWAVNLTNRCSKCFFDDNPAIETETDLGQRKVAECQLCGTLHRPYQTLEEKKRDLAVMRDIYGPSLRPAQKTVPAINFSKLPEAISLHLRCPSCGETRDNTVVRTLTDEGEKEVAMCSSCDVLFRPWERPFSVSAGLSGAASVISSSHSAVKPANSRKKRTTPTDRKNAVKKPKKIIFSKLVRALSHQQECFYCNHETNDSRMMDTDEGRKRLVVCDECGEIMRPFAKKN